MSPLSPSGRQSKEPVCRKRLCWVLAMASFSVGRRPTEGFPVTVVTGYSVVERAVLRRVERLPMHRTPSPFTGFCSASSSSCTLTPLPQQTVEGSTESSARRRRRWSGRRERVAQFGRYRESRLESVQETRSFHLNMELSSIRLRQGHPALRDSPACIRPDGGM